MIGNQKLIDTLNALIARERTGIDQYRIHRAKFVNWQFAGQIFYFDERIADEQRHQDMLEDRVLFLRGTITPGVINQVSVGVDVPEIFRFDQVAEIDAIAAYNEAIALAISVGDEDTARLLRGILSDETDHLNDIEARQDQMSMVGDQGWLAINIRECV